MSLVVIFIGLTQGMVFLAPLVHLEGGISCIACNTGGCPKDKAFALIRDGKLLRITFSRSLAHHIAQLADPRPKVHRITFQVGRFLEPGDPSSSGAYALISRKSGAVLRVSLIRECAELLCDESRYLAECWVTKVLLPEKPAEAPYDP